MQRERGVQCREPWSSTPHEMVRLDSRGLNRAIRDNKIGAIEGHLTAKGSPDADTGFGTALGFAVAKGREEIAARLVDAGASLDLPDSSYGDTPLHRAAFNGRLKTFPTAPAVGARHARPRSARQVQAERRCARQL